MSFRGKLLALFTAAMVLAVGLVAVIVSGATRRAFERADEQRTDALVTQFRREFARRGTEVSGRVAALAGAESSLRMAIDLSRPGADPAPYVSEAASMAASQQLDFLEVVGDDGAIISSSQWPARFGYHEDWVTQVADWNAHPAFLRAEPLPAGPVLALESVRVVRVADRNLYLVGGERLDREFLGTLTLPLGMRALLYSNLAPGFSPGAVTDPAGPVPLVLKLAPLIQKVQQQPQAAVALVDWDGDPAHAELFHALPLMGWQNELLGVLLVGSSRRDLVLLDRYIRSVALLVGGVGILLALGLSGWVARRVTRPVEQLAEAANEVAAGRWETRVPVRSDDEVGQLAEAFNQMTQHLVEQRDRLVQAERVAAWRELARRLAHELKNPLFPLQITVENLLRARQQNPAQFDEVFRESATTLLAEIANLKTIVGRFSDFAKMPRPQLQSVRVNEVVEGAMKVFAAQLTAPGRPGITPRLELDLALPAIQADPDLLHRALSNLVLNAMDAMPQGGTLTLRTAKQEGGVRLEVSDTGEGLTPEECERLFTPYYTSKQHGTGLGLAIVQSVVSDHGGKITVASQPKRGTTFCIELPQQPPEGARGPEHA
ncbi:MAG TPA: ATP-binding protein [Terriglobales bacterium]|nr:ATP-binding protein [Terriglobales bacterium]